TAPPSYPQWRAFAGHHAWKYSQERLRLQNGSGKPPGTHDVHGPDVEVFRCPAWIPENPGGAKRLFHLASFGLSSLAPMMKQVRWAPQIVLLVEPTLFCALPALLVARWSGAKAWLHIQDFEIDAAFELGDLSSFRVRNWALPLKPTMLGPFDRFSAISDRMVEPLPAKGADPSRCILFPNWVDTSEIHPLAGPSPFREELGITESTVVAL